MNAPENQSVNGVREIIAVGSDVHKKHVSINRLHGLKADFLNLSPPGTGSNRWAIQG